MAKLSWDLLSYLFVTF